MYILQHPHPMLSAKAKMLSSIDQAALKLIKEMRRLMHISGGVGLAAPQIGWDARVIILNPSGDGKENDRVMINPIIERSFGRNVIMIEGCLSIPGQTFAIERPESINVSYEQMDGTKVNNTYSGWTARIIQHEVDHLFGFLLHDKR